MWNYRHTPRINETLGAARNQLLSASDLIDADDSAVKEICTLRIDCVRVPDNKLPVWFHCDAHWANQITTFRKHELLSRVDMHADYSAHAEIHVCGRNVSHIDICPLHRDPLWPLEIAAARD